VAIGAVVPPLHRVTHVWTCPWFTDNCSVTIQSTKTTQKWGAVAGSGERKVATRGPPDG